MAERHSHWRLRASALLVATALASSAHADPFAHLRPVPLDEAALQGMRGGFDDGQGLRASFGLERSTSVNGALVVSQSILIPDLSRITTDQASQLRTMLSSVTLVRNGADNVVTPAAANGLAGSTVIQNTLDGQTIKSLTVINATTNSLGFLQSLNAASTLRNALIAPVSSRP